MYLFGVDVHYNDMCIQYCEVYDLRDSSSFGLS